MTTVVINRYTGSGPTATQCNGANQRLDNSDNQSTGETNNPIPIPGSGTANSFCGTFGLHCTSPAPTGINNIVWYTQGGSAPFGTGIGLNVNAVNSYTQATSTGVPSLSTNDAYQYTSASPLSLSGTIGATTGNFGQFIQLQFTVASTASPGPTSSNSGNLTFQFDVF